MKTAAVETYKVSVTFNAPIDFVFKWCTDFREDDGKMTGSKTKRHFLERTKKRIIWVVSYNEGGEPKEGVRVVRLMPPDAWHFDTCGDSREAGDYKLVSLSKNKTRLDLVFNVTYDNRKDVESRDTWQKETKDLWAVYSKYLEKDYKAETGGR